MIRLLILVLAWVLLVESRAGAGPLSGNACLSLSRDTVKQNSKIFLPDSLIQDTLRYEYSKIKKVAYRRKWTKELYKDDIR